MKIQPFHYVHLRDAIANLPLAAIADIQARVEHDPRTKDRAKRFRWDLLWATVPSRWVCDNLYPYLDDSHIDTALKAIVKELGL